MTHDNDAVALANMTLWINLVKALNAKGLFTDEDYTALLNNAISDLATHEQGASAIAVIREVAKV